MASALQKNNFSFFAAVGWLSLVFLLTLGASLWPLPVTPDQIDANHLSAAPGGGHLLGTDAMGRDIAVRLALGARVSLTVGACAPLLGLAMGVLLGMPAGYWRGWTERIIMTFIDVLLAFPGLIFLLVFTFILGSTLTTLTIGLGVITAPRFVRVVRANTIKFAGREFVQAARITGAGNTAILLREILPNMLGSLLAYSLVVAGFVIIAEGGLGFLGLSVPSPMPSWGGMIAEGREVLGQTPHVTLIPTAVMFLTILSINIIGDKVKEKYDGRESRL